MRTSSSIEPEWARRTLRAGGIVLLVVVEGTAGLFAWGAYRLNQVVERPSREARYAAITAGAPVGQILPVRSGYVDHFRDDAIAIMTVGGLALVRVDRFTVFRTEDCPARGADVHPGANLIVAGEPDDTGVVLADVVVVRPPQ